MSAPYARPFSLASFLLVLACASPVADVESRAPAEAAGNQAAGRMAFVGVNVIPMDSERILENHTVLIEGDRIVSLGPAAEITVPAGAVEIDGTGKYLLPGLAEMHGHIPPPNQPEAFIESVLFLYVANGVTTVRGMQGANGQLELRNRAARGDLVSPTLYLAGPSFSGDSVRSPEEAIERVRRQKAEGWDLLKVHGGLSVPTYDAMATTAKEVGIRFGGHVPADVGLIHAIEMGQETFDHLDGYIQHLQGDRGPVNEAQLADIVRRTRDAGAWVVPTMALWETLTGTASLETLVNLPELRYMPPAQVEQWTTLHRNRISAEGFDPETAEQIIANRMRILRALHDGGVPVLLGTDAPQQFSVPGFSIHREVRVMEDAGMSRYDILHSGTAAIGRYFRGQDMLGTVAPGQRADLLLLNANPLEDLAALENRAGVMVRGRWLSEDRIRERLEEIAASYN